MKDRAVSLLSRLYLSVSRWPRAVVVTLHRVGGGSSITSDHLRAQLEFLARHYDMIRPSQLRACGSKRGVAMVTVDDSHQDVYHHLFPVAKAFNVPLTICVPTDFFFRRQWLWFDQLYWTLKQADSSHTIEVSGRSLAVGDRASIDWLKRFLKSQPPPARNEILRGLAAQIGCMVPEEPVDGYRPVALDEMRQMMSSGLVEIASHTETHTIATVMPDDDLRRELANSKKELEAFSGREVSTFCYPNGHIGDFDQRTTRLVQEAGYKLALTSVEGTNRLDALDPYTVMRIHTHPRQGVFERRASGLGDWYR